MIHFLLFALYLMFGATMLIVWPIATHPTLPRRRKIILSCGVFILLVPVACALYLWLGAPQLAAY